MGHQKEWSGSASKGVPLRSFGHSKILERRSVLPLTICWSYGAARSSSWSGYPSLAIVSSLSSVCLDDYRFCSS